MATGAKFLTGDALGCWTDSTNGGVIFGCFGTGGGVNFGCWTGDGGESEESTNSGAIGNVS